MQAKNAYRFAGLRDTPSSKRSSHMMDRYGMGYGRNRFGSGYSPEFDDYDRFQVSDDEGHFESKKKSIFESDNEEEVEKTTGSETEEGKSDVNEVSDDIQSMLSRQKEEEEKKKEEEEKKKEEEEKIYENLDAYHEHLRQQFPDQYKEQEEKKMEVEEESSDDYGSDDSMQDLSD